MKKGEIYEAIVEKVEFPNKGIVHVGEEKVIVKNAIPGQKIQFVINKKRNGKCEGRLLEVLEASELERKEGACPHFGVCGGCLYQSLPYEEQLKIKEGQIKSLLDSVCKSYEFEGIKGSPISDGYRNKMEFSFGDEYKGGPLALGMHRRGSFYDIVNTPQCHIVHEDFRKILTATLEYFTEKGMGYYRKLQHEGYLRHLLVRRAVKTGEILVALVTSGQTGKEGMPQSLETEKVLLEEWKKTLLALKMEGSFAGILHIRNRVKNNGSYFEDNILQKLQNGERQPHGFGIGLLNVLTRLQITYGDPFGLQVYNEYDEYDTYAIAEIRIPAVSFV